MEDEKDVAADKMPLWTGLQDQKNGQKQGSKAGSKVDGICLTLLTLVQCGLFLSTRNQTSRGESSRRCVGKRL